MFDYYITCDVNINFKLRLTLIVYFFSCVLTMLRSLHEQNIHTQDEAKEYMGKIFRIKFIELPPWASDEEICDFIMK